MKRILSVILALSLAISVLSLPSFASGDHTGISTYSDDSSGGTSGGGELLFSMSVSGLEANAVRTSRKEGKYFQVSTLSKKYIQFTGTLTSSVGILTRCGICWIDDTTGDAVAVNASVEYFQSGVWSVSDKVSKGSLIYGNTYYGFVRNTSSAGTVRGTLNFYQIN